MPFENTGQLTATPFVYCVSGTAFYPPNTIYESATNALAAAGQRPFREVLKDLAKSGNVDGTWMVLPETGWYHYLLNFWKRRLLGAGGRVGSGLMQKPLN
jgi:hypothetical protein